MAETKTNIQHGADVTEEISFDIPPECSVIFFNDDFTTKEFVVEVLMSIFHKSEAEAVGLMELVHTAGKAVVGVYTYDIAVTRANMTTVRAKKNGFPLTVEVSQE